MRREGNFTGNNFIKFLNCTIFTGWGDKAVSQHFFSQMSIENRAVEKWQSIEGQTWVNLCSREQTLANLLPRV